MTADIFFVDYYWLVQQTFYLFFLPRFPKTKGVAGHVASTGETLNITDAYHDERFNRYVWNLP